MVERKGFALVVDLEYERVSEFCHPCEMIGLDLLHKIVGGIRQWYIVKRKNRFLFRRNLI